MASPLDVPPGRATAHRPHPLGRSTRHERRADGGSAMGSARHGRATAREPWMSATGLSACVYLKTSVCKPRLVGETCGVITSRRDADEQVPATRAPPGPAVGPWPARGDEPRALAKPACRGPLRPSFGAVIPGRKANLQLGEPLGQSVIRWPRIVPM